MNKPAAAHLSKLRAAVIGGGYLGRFHVQKYAALGDVELAAVVDLDRRRAEGLAAAMGCAAYQDYRKVLGSVDMVSIVVPTESHYSIARACLDAGVHVLLEKPMTETVQEADDLIELAKVRGVLLQVGHLERFNPAVLALRGTLLNPMFIESHRIAPFQPRGTDISVVMDLMIHDIDIILSMVPSDIAAIRPVGLPVLTDTVDIANARIEFANGCVANVTASRVSRTQMRKIRVFQPDAYFSIDYLANKIAISRRRLDPELGAAAYRIGIEEKSFDHCDALMMEIRAFVDAVRNETAPAVSGEDGRRALRVALAITHAMR